MQVILINSFEFTFFYKSTKFVPAHDNGRFKSLKATSSSVAYFSQHIKLQAFELLSFFDVRVL